MDEKGLSKAYGGENALLDGIPGTLTYLPKLGRYTSLLAVKAAVAILISAVVLLAVAATMGIVGFHYPKIIRDQPLQHPQKVLPIEGPNLVLENGAVIALEGIEASDISNKLRQSEFAIDVEGDQGSALAIWARQDGWVCGTPWAQPVRIPLIRDTTYQNCRRMIALGSYVRSPGQQDSAANRGQPVGSGTNGTPAAAVPVADLHVKPRG